METAETANPIIRFLSGVVQPHASFTDPRRREQLGLQNGILLALSLTILILLPIQWLVSRQLSPQSVSIAVILILSYILSRTRFPLAGTYLSVLGLVALIVSSIPQAVNPAVFIFVVLLPLLLGTLFTSFWQQLILIIVTVTAAGVALFQFTPNIAGAPGANFAYGLIIFFGILIAGLSAAYNRILQTVSNQANRLEIIARELATANEALEAERDALEQRVTDRTRILETAYAVSREIGRASNIEELFRTVTELLKQSFGYYHVHAYLLDADQGRLLMRGGTGEAGATMLARGHSLAVGQGLVGSAADTGVAVLVPDVTDNPNWLPNPLLPNTKSEVAVPIREGDRVVGVIDVQQDQAYALGQEDAELLQSIAVQVGVVLRNLQNLEQSEQAARRKALTVEIARRIQATTSVDEALQVTARELGRALNGAPTHVMLSPEREN